MSPLLRENGRTPVAYVSGTGFLSWSFMGLPRKPSYSASFLHWIFLLSYPYSITLYIFDEYLNSHLSRPPFEHPGSAGAGPRHVSVCACMCVPLCVCVFMCVYVCICLCTCVSIGDMGFPYKDPDYALNLPLTDVGYLKISNKWNSKYGMWSPNI